MTLRTATQAMILLTIFIWIGWDLYVYLGSGLGNPITESATIWRFAWLLPSIDVAVGILLGHLFLQFRPPSTASIAEWNKLGLVKSIILGIVLIWVGFDIYAFFYTDAGCAFSQWLWLRTGHYTWMPILFGCALGSIFFQMHEATELPGE
jgi:hypothetical protein